MQRRRTWLLVGALALAGAVLACLGASHLLTSPRVTVDGVEKEIQTTLPQGCSREDVCAWLEIHAVRLCAIKDERGRRGVEAWMLNTGSPLVWQWVWDIRLQFFFDGDGRLIDHSVTEEDRF